MLNEHEAAVGTFLRAQPLEGVCFWEARVGDDLGAQFDGQVDGLVALWKFAVVQESQELGQSHLRWEGLTWGEHREKANTRP